MARLGLPAILTVCAYTLNRLLQKISMTKRCFLFMLIVHIWLFHLKILLMVIIIQAMMHIIPISGWSLMVETKMPLQDNQAREMVLLIILIQQVLSVYLLKMMPMLRFILNLPLLIRRPLPITGIILLLLPQRLGQQFTILLMAPHLPLRLLTPRPLSL